MSSRLLDTRDFCLSLVAGALIGIGAMLPYPARVRSFVRVVARMISPFGGFTRTIRDNLAKACPELSEAELKSLTRRVPENAVRPVVENLFSRDLAPYARAAPINGAEGLAAIERAQAEGRGVLLMSAHLGNPIVAGIALRERGYKVGDIYRPLRNRWLAARWAAALREPLDALFPRDRRGMAQMVNFLRSGGMVLVLNDQYNAAGAPLSFFGHTAYTSLSAAKLALKYDAPMVPIYAIRRADGLNFEVVVEPPIPHSTPERMTQNYNDSLEQRVRRNMDQWFWVYRRWKGGHERREPEPPPKAAQTEGADGGA